MHNSVAKKLFAVGVAVSTVLVGLAPFAAQAAAHTEGTSFLKADGTVCLITGGQQRCYTSGGAFLSYGFNSWNQVVNANADDLALPMGALIPPQDGKVFCATETKGTDVKGECSLVTGGMKAAFTSQPVFTGLGFTFARANSGDSSFLQKTSNIDNTTAAHRPGVLVHFMYNGHDTVFLVGTSGLMGIPDPATFQSWGYSFKDVVAANAADQGMSVSGVMATRQAGQLSPSAVNGSTPPPTGNAISVSPASDTPAATTLASGTAHDAVLKFNLTAGTSGSVNVTGLNVTKGGFVSNTNVSGVSVYDASGHRHGNEASTLGANGVATLTFPSDPIVVGAGQTVPVWVKVNLCLYNGCSGSTTYTGTISMGINAASDVVTSNGATVSGTFPVVGNTMSIVAGNNSVAAITFDQQAVNATGATLNVDPNSEQQIAKFRVQETSSNEAVKLYSLTLTNYGNASASSYKDVQLQDQTGTVLATAQPNGQVVMFDLSSNPYFIDKGQTKDFSVWAKIVGGTTQTIQFVAYNNYDVDVRGVSTGAGILPTAGSNANSVFPVGSYKASGCTSGTSCYNKVTVGNGTMVFSRDAASPTSAITPGQTSVELARYDVTAQGEDMEIRGISFGVNKSGSTDLSGTLYVKVDGAIVYSATASSAEPSTTTRTMTSYPVIKAGVQSVITVVADINSNATSSDGYRVDAFKITSVKRLTSNDIDNTGTSSLNGNTLSVQSGKLTVTTLATPVATSFVPTAPGQTLASFQLNAQSSGEDVKVSSIKVTDTLSTGSAYTDLANLVMYSDNGSSSGTPVVLQTSGSTATNANTVTFNFVTPILVTRTNPVTLWLKGDIIANTDSENHTFKINNADGNVTATGAVTGNTVAYANQTISGTGQAMTLTTGGTLTGSLVNGSGATPSVSQVVQVGAMDNTYLAFKLTSQYEAQKITSLTIHATGTFAGGATTGVNDIRNIRLYRQVGTGTVDANPFASASQFAACTTTSCYYTWTSADNLLPAPIDPSQAVTIYVKADVGPQGTVYLGDSFYMGVNMTGGADVTAKGAQSGSAPSSYNGGFLRNTSATNNIVPFSVAVSGDYPTQGSNNSSSLSGAIAGRFKITNNGNTQVTINKLKFTDSGSHATHDWTYKVLFSDDGQSNYAQNTATTTTNDMLYLATSVTSSNSSGLSSLTINGGSYRYVEVQILAGGTFATGDSVSLSISSLGDVTYTAPETGLGYDATQNGSLGDTTTSLVADGKPTVGTIYKP